MRITVIGLGYVGLVTSACLADLGHRITGVDTSEHRLDSLRSGRVPFHEPGLTPMVEAGIRDGRIVFSADSSSAVRDADIVIIAVGTHDGNGGWQTGTILGALGDVVPAMADDAVLLIRSTMPPGFVHQVRVIARELRARHGRPAIATMVNPEFTKEGTAIRDFLEPDRVVIGSIDDPDRRGERRLRELYEPLQAPIVVLSGIDASLTKLAANLFLATKISFANELARLCETFGGDVERVVEGMSHDQRIGGSFLRAGVGFGGSCLPHQVTMTVRAARTAGLEMPLMTAVDGINHDQRRLFVDRLAALAGGLDARRVALLGLTFKPETDDLRDAPSLVIARLLMERGAKVVAYDPMAVARAQAVGLVPGLRVADSPEAALAGADVAGLVTEWHEFRELDWSRMASVMASPAIVDGRNALDRVTLAEAGFDYVGFGRSKLDRSARPDGKPVMAKALGAGA